MWLRFLSEWNGVSLFLDCHTTSQVHLHLYTDSSSVGYGGIYGSHWFAEKWPADLNIKTHTGLAMSFLELYPIVVATMLWGQQWKCKRVFFLCDNSATVNIIRKGRSKCTKIMQLMRRLTWCAATYNCLILAKHVPGVSNSTADALSRLQMDRFRQLAPMQIPTPTSARHSNKYCGIDTYHFNTLGCCHQP